jgi:hypothetical protein
MQTRDRFWAVQMVLSFPTEHFLVGWDLYDQLQEKNFHVLCLSGRSPLCYQVAEGRSLRMYSRVIMELPHIKPHLEFTYRIL